MLCLIVFLVVVLHKIVKLKRNASRLKQAG